MLSGRTSGRRHSLVPDVRPDSIVRCAPDFASIMPSLPHVRENVVDLRRCFAEVGPSLSEGRHPQPISATGGPTWILHCGPESLGRGIGSEVPQLACPGGAHG